MNKKYKISFILNIMIVLFTIVATIIMFTGIRFMDGVGPDLEATKIGMFKFFTVDSNLFMGIIALLFAIEEFKVITNKEKKISDRMYVLKLTATTSVTLTFITVFAYLGPISPGGIYSMLLNSNLFFHLIIPVLSMISFICFECENKIPSKYVICGVIPTLIYSIFYLFNILLHMKNGKVSTDYDWYWFVQEGVWTSLIVVPLVLFSTYLISLMLWKLNTRESK